MKIKLKPIILFKKTKKNILHLLYIYQNLIRRDLFSLLYINLIIYQVKQFLEITFISIISQKRWPTYTR